MDLDQYDEFGTYIGPELESSDESSSDQEQGGGGGDAGSQNSEGGPEADLETNTGMEVVLHEDKKYYPTALEVCNKIILLLFTFL